MRYQEIRPSPLLSPYLECFWNLRSQNGEWQAEPQRILPDGCLELILNFANPFAQFEGGTARRQPLQFVVGQMERHLLIRPTGPVDLLGVRFRPAGAFPFLRGAVSELTGRLEPLDAVSRQLHREVTESLYTVAPGARIARMESILLRWAANGTGDACIEEAVRRVIRSDGRVPVAELVAQLGVSERQLERRFQQRVGLSAKRLGRIIRFQSVFRAAERGAMRTGADLAAACGYYDQAHFIREFREFTGESPAAFLARMAPLTEVFTRKDRASDSYNTVA